jgi:hypothetical protein
VQVVLPKNNYFGITAATPDKPDSFSIHNIFLSSPEYHLPENQHMERTPDFHAYDDAYDRWNKEHNGEDHEADYYKTHEEQFSDLHDRLQALVCLQMLRYLYYIANCEREIEPPSH